MPGTPIDWNVVVLGAWNVAILTPAGIARRVFRLEPATPVEVQVSLDAQLPMRVSHANLMVTASGSMIVVAPSELTSEGLCKAALAASNAIQSLPETPLTAAGVNIRYKLEAIPDELLDGLRSSLDDRLAETNHRITGRAIKRTLRWNQADLNIEVQEDEHASGSLLLNFHFSSTDPQQLLEWLSQADSMAKQAEDLASTFKVKSNKDADD